MDILLSGIFIFFAVHLLPGFVNVRNKLISNLGEGPYKGLYSLTALSGLVLIIYGKSKAEYLSIWEPPLWSKHVVILTMLISFYFLVAADMKSNIKRFIRHPMLLGVALWAGVHLLANGDLASILLFGSFLIFSLIAMVSANVRGATKQQNQYSIKSDIVTVFASVVAYVIFIKYLHPLLIGVSII